MYDFTDRVYHDGSFNFFVGLSIKEESKSDKWLKGLMLLHGAFFISCFIMPMTGIFTSMANGDNSNGGTIALPFCILYYKSYVPTKTS